MIKRLFILAIGFASVATSMAQDTRQLSIEGLFDLIEQN